MRTADPAATRAPICDATRRDFSERPRLLLGPRVLGSASLWAMSRRCRACVDLLGGGVDDSLPLGSHLPRHSLARQEGCDGPIHGLRRASNLLNQSKWQADLDDTIWRS